MEKRLTATDLVELLARAWADGFDMAADDGPIVFHPQHVARRKAEGRAKAEKIVDSVLKAGR